MAASRLELVLGTPSDGHATFILVHGTYAPDATWVRTGALFDALVADHPDAVFYAFRWTGLNSHIARLTAGRELARAVRDLATAPIHLVGHSHGGNVILYSLRDERAACAIRSVGFLGTPFIICEVGDHGRHAELLARTTSWLILIPGIFPALTLGLSFGIAEINQSLGVIALFATAPIIGVLYFVFGRVPLRRTMTRAIGRFLEQRGRFRRMWLRPGRPSCPSFVARVALDEAGLWLRVVAVVSSLPQLGIAVVSRSILAMIVAFFTCFLLIIIFEVTPAKDDAFLLPIIAIFVFAFVLLVAPLLTSLWIAGIRGSRWGFGGEGLAGGMAAQIFSSATPPWRLSTTCAERLIRPTRARFLPSLLELRHSSFYNNVELARDYASWVTKNRNGAFADALPLREGNSHPSALVQLGIPVAAAALVMAYMAFVTNRELTRISGTQEVYDVPLQAVTGMEVARIAVRQPVKSVKGAFDLALRVEAPFHMTVPRAKRCYILGDLSFPSWDIDAYLVSTASHETATPFGGGVDILSWNSSSGKHVTLIKDLSPAAFERRISLWIASNSDGGPVTGVIWLRCRLESTVPSSVIKGRRAQ